MAHTYTDLISHIVFSTKDRQPTLTQDIRPGLFAYMAGICENLNCKAYIINGPNDHVHALVSIPPALAISKFLEKFKANPEQFAPQFGGYCSFAVSKGYTADGDPNAWKVVDGKLYLNYSPKVKEMWEVEQEQRIKDGEKNWREFQTKKPQHKG